MPDPLLWSIGCYGCAGGQLVQRYALTRDIVAKSQADMDSEKFVVANPSYVSQ